MKIRILNLVEGAREATGVAVIIDVFRAMSVEAYLMDKGVAAIYPVGDKQIAYDYKITHPDAVLIGERRGVILPGFDFGNSPSQFESADLRGKTVVHTTSAGTQGIANAVNAERILTGSLVNAGAIAEYLLAQNCPEVSLVCMGLLAERPIEEDTLCAEYLESLLIGKPLDPTDRIKSLKTTSGAKFFDPEKQEIYPQRDFELCTRVSRFSFVLEILRAHSGGMDCVRRIDV